jgi:hypothetical protein
MVMIVQGDTNMFNSLVYGAQKHPGTLAFLENQVSQFGGALTEFGQAFFNSAKTLYDNFNSSEAMRIARAATRKFDSLFASDTIQTIWDLGRLQHAPLTMQRWIMAEPTTRTLFHQQRCDGYSGSYVDMEPGRVGEDHYDYRRVYSDVVQDTEDGGWVVNHYLDEILEGDAEPEFDQKVDIIDTHAFAKAHAEAGREDHTSKWNEML